MGFQGTQVKVISFMPTQKYDLPMLVYVELTMLYIMTCRYPISN
jgi:hypothetical protein